MTLQELKDSEMLLVTGERAGNLLRKLEQLGNIVSEAKFNQFKAAVFEEFPCVCNDYYKSKGKPAPQCLVHNDWPRIEKMLREIYHDETRTDIPTGVRGK